VQSDPATDVALEPDGPHADGRGAGAGEQGLTLVQFSAQLERFARDMGCALGLCSPCEGSCRASLGCEGCILVSDTAQVALMRGRV
jgi:hypothetical protein